MANLWRALALSWLGGMASPALTGDMMVGETRDLAPILSRSAEKLVTANYVGMDKALPDSGVRPEIGERDFTRV